MEHRLWIDGQWTDSRGGGTLTIENPATGEKIGEVPDGSREDVDRAVQAAKTASSDGGSSRMRPEDRSRIRWTLADLIEAHAEELARVETENTGKPYQKSSLEGDLPYTVSNLRFFAAAARDTHGARAGEYSPNT